MDFSFLDNMIKGIEGLGKMAEENIQSVMDNATTEEQIDFVNKIKHANFAKSATDLKDLAREMAQFKKDMK